MEAYEKCSLVMSEPFDTEVTVDMSQKSAPLPDPHKKEGYFIDFDPISGEMGPKNQDILVKLSDSSSEEDFDIAFILESVDGLSDSEMSGLASGDSDTNPEDCNSVDLADFFCVAAKRSVAEDTTDVPKRSTPLNFDIDTNIEENLDVDTSLEVFIRTSTDGLVASEMPDSSTGGSSDFPSFLQPRTIFGGVWGSVTFQLKRFRNRGYFLPFEIICLAFTITCCFLGAYNWDMCPANVYIPRYVFFNGVVATFAVFVQIVDSIGKLVVLHFDDYKKYFFAFLIGWVAVITTLIEITEFYTMSYSFRRNEENYCNEAFYWCVNYKNMALVVLMTLTAMIYYPSFNFNYLAAYVR